VSLETYKQARPTSLHSTESENIQIINQIYRDFLARDMRSVLEAFDENIDWDGTVNWPGGPRELPFTGRKQGREEVAEAFQQFLLTFEFARSMSHNTYVEVGNTVVVTGSDIRTVLPTGETTENRWTMIWTIENGKATKFRMYQDSVPELEPHHSNL
jgi:ketosteroid isomerase-like protein